MPRKNARPAAKKAAKRKAERMANPKPKRVGIIGHHGRTPSLALLAAAMIAAPRYDNDA